MKKVRSPGNRSTGQEKTIGTMSMKITSGVGELGIEERIRLG
jgi:hypothetical protein